MYKSFVCFICNGRLMRDEISMISCCGHTFHYRCILHWVRVFGECPVCYSQSHEKYVIKQLFFTTGSRSRRQGWINYLSLSERRHKENVKELQHLKVLQKDQAIFTMQITEAIRALYEVVALKQIKASYLFEFTKREFF